MGIKEQIRDHTLGNLYLLYGEEQYLVRLNTSRIVEALLIEEDRLMNLERISKIDPDQLLISITTLPFMAEKRIVIVEDSRIFGGEKGKDSLLEDLLKQLPESTVLIFQETKVDKRSRSYKLLTGKGEAIEYPPLEESSLLAFIAYEMKGYPVSMGRREALHLLRYTGSDMEKIVAELTKVASYCLEKGSVSTEDIDAIVSPTLESRIFTLTDALSRGDTAQAFESYRLLREQNEPISRILYMISRQYDLLFRSALLLSDQPGISPDELAASLKLQRFLGKEYRSIAQRYGLAALSRIIARLAEAEWRMKSGGFTEEEAITLVMTEYTQSHCAQNCVQNSAQIR